MVKSRENCKKEMGVSLYLGEEFPLDSCEMGQKGKYIWG